MFMNYLHILFLVFLNLNFGILKSEIKEYFELNEKETIFVFFCFLLVNNNVIFNIKKAKSNYKQNLIIFCILIENVNYFLYFY